MANFAVMSGDVVSNVIVADAVENAELATNSVCIEYTDANPAGIGWSYDSVTKKFIAPPNPITN
jgi:hypothetical protein